VKINVQITCEGCGESHGTIDLGPQKLSEFRGAKKMGEFVGSLLPMFLRQGIEHECPMTDERRTLIKKFLLKDKCPKCGGRVGIDPKTHEDACSECDWRCSRAMLEAVKDSL